MSAIHGENCDLININTWNHGMKSLKEMLKA